MGATIGKSGGYLLDALPTQSTLHVVMLGLDSAGKTTALYRLKFDQYLNTVPTIGFNCEKIHGTIGKAKGVQFLVWDVGGQEKLRPLWRSYTRCTDGILFVVDSVDVERIEEAKMELMRTAKSPDNQGVPVLILANKQDLPGARDPKELEKLLGLHELQYPTLIMGAVSSETSSSESTRNIVGCSVGRGDPNFRISAAAKHNVCSSSTNYAAGRSLTPQQSRSVGEYGENVSSSISITNDLCMPHKTKLYSSNSSNTPTKGNQHSLHAASDTTLGVGSIGPRSDLHWKEFTVENKTPCSIATTSTGTTSQYLTAAAGQTLPPTTPTTIDNTSGTPSLKKNWRRETSGITTAAKTINTLQYEGWFIQPACAITGEGLQEGLDALYEMILKRRKFNKTFKKKR